MPSSSLFLGSCTTFVSALSLLLTSVPTVAGDNFVYGLSKEYSGTSFFDGWDFYDSADPNKGFVTYVDQNTAQTSGLIRFEDGDAIMGVDSTNTYDPNSPYYGANGYGRPSVRISTQQSFDQGLFILDLKHMPGGVCGVWPAFWAIGADGNWPYSGEIDIIESVNSRETSLAALHTGGQCRIAGDARSMTGSLQSVDCQYDVATGSGSVGCAIVDTDTSTYGPGLNAAGGAIYAMEWTSDAIKIWSFSSSDVPSDIDSANPDPTSWGIPAQTFNGPSCDLESVIQPQKLVFDTNFCGDFGNAVWASEGCQAQTGAQTCADWVAGNPAQFSEMYWQIGSLKYYQKNAVVSTTASSSTIQTSQPFASTTFITSTLMTTIQSSPSTMPTSSIAAILDSSTSIFSFTESISPSISPSSIAVVSEPSTSVFSFTESIPSTTAVAISATLIIATPVTTSSLISLVVSYMPTSVVALSAQTTTTWTWTMPDSLTTGKPEGSHFLPPLGSGVSITPGWNATQPIQWENFPAATTTQAALVTGTWSQWLNSNDSAISVTITKSWIEPCETGYTTKTTYIITTHCGCIETPVPTVPMTVITTTCPESWGFTTPVVVTMPAIPTPIVATIAAVSTWSPIWQAANTIETQAAQTRSIVWSTGSTASGAAIHSWSNLPSVGNSKSFAADASVSSWSTWTSSPAVTTTASISPSQVWSGWNGTSNPYVGKWTGAANKASVGAGVLGFALAIAALIL